MRLVLPRYFSRPYVSQAGLPPTIKKILSSSIDTSHSTQGTEAGTTVYGWIKSVRRQKNVSFAVVNDGSTLKGLQAVFLHLNAEQAAPPKGLTSGTSVCLTGKLIKSAGKGQEKELRVESIEVLGECDPETYPIQKKEHSLEFLRDNTHLRARTDNIAAMLRIRDKLVRAFDNWFEREGFIHAHAPVTTGNDCEGAGEAFRVVTDVSEPHASSTTSPSPVIIPSPSSPTYLTTSTQLHLEALASAISRVYTLAPSFRAERSQTNRHLSEFWMVEAEMAFLPRGVDSVCEVVEASLKAALGNLANDEDVAFLRSTSQSDTDWDAWLSPSKPWGRITYTDALNALYAHHAAGAEPQFTLDPPEWGGALRSEHERWIAENMSGGAAGPVFVTDYPRRLKPFYMWVNSGQGDVTRRTVACFDLLVPRLGELTGGSVRESRMDVLRDSLVFHGMEEADHSWYIDLRRYGTTPHGGFGIGFERLVSWFCGIENVRECIAFPRWAGRVLL